MKKILLAVASAVVLLFAASAYTPGEHSMVGESAPDFELMNSEKTIEIGEFRGQYVLLSFWASTDPESRIANKAYADWASDENNNVEFVAVNFDPSSKVFEEIMKIDNLDSSKQFHIDGNNKEVLEDDYKLREGFVSLLINPDGEVIAQNPSEQDLEVLVKS